MTTLICDCNRTQPLQTSALSRALGEPLTLHSSLCRREVGAFQKAIQTSPQVVVACTQEQRLLTEVAEQTPGAVSVIKFVNIRETGGWSRDALQSSPKIAALLAAARLPEPEPVPVVTYKSQGKLLIVGPLDAAERAAALLGDVMQVTIFAEGAGNAGGAQTRRYPVLAGRITQLKGWLGAFEVSWEDNNPINLDLCTRCNACVQACPENAIGLDYQVDLSRCDSHRSCLKVCQSAGAIDFGRSAVAHTEHFDVLLDLRSLAASPTFNQHAPPQGYARWDGVDLKTLLQVRDWVGEFEKPKFFAYKQKLCAHSRNETVGCSACIEICSAEAIRSDTSRQQIVVNPNLCVGCGACTTVCPSGALSYVYPKASEQGQKIKTLLSTYAGAGGKQAVLLLHSQQAGQELVEQLGRAAQLRLANGVPAQVIPMGLWHTASLGLEVWLSAVAQGASQLVVLLTNEEAPQYAQGLRAQMAVAQAILNGLGYQGSHFKLIQENTPAGLDAALQSLAAERPAGPEQVARFAVTSEKRATLELALDHLMAAAPALAKPPVASSLGVAPEAVIELPSSGSPLGTVKVNRERCTLCLSCVSACPASALQDNPQLPQLRFIEKNCVQCGLCVNTCPEDALQLQPRLLLGSERKQPVVLNETQPYACVRCRKPFGTLKAVEAMLAKLSGHSMFQGEALERLKMCSDCRVIDMFSDSNEARIGDLSRGEKPN